MSNAENSFWGGLWETAKDAAETVGNLAQEEFSRFLNTIKNPLEHAPEAFERAGPKEFVGVARPKDKNLYDEVKESRQIDYKAAMANALEQFANDPGGHAPVSKEAAREIAHSRTIPTAKGHEKPIGFDRSKMN